MLCRLKNMLGEPNKGIHSIRLFNVAIVDVLMTIIASVVISKIFHIPLVFVLICLFSLGIVMHRVFCVRTTVDKLLFK